MFETLLGSCSSRKSMYSFLSPNWTNASAYRWVWSLVVYCWLQEYHSHTHTHTHTHSTHTHTYSYTHTVTHGSLFILSSLVLSSFSSLSLCCSARSSCCRSHSRPSSSTTAAGWVAHLLTSVLTSYKLYSTWPQLVGTIYSVWLIRKWLRYQYYQWTLSEHTYTS